MSARTSARAGGEQASAVEQRRRQALVDAAIAEIGEAGSLDVTVARIARRAGVSPALAHHYFGHKEQIFLAAMRHILARFAAAVRRALAEADPRGPRARLEALIRASFGPEQFEPEVVAAWLNFYVQARTLPEASRLLAIYGRRLRANLTHDLARLMPRPEAERASLVLAALIDGCYLRQVLHERDLGRHAAIALVLGELDRMLAASPGAPARPRLRPL
ncbi:MAG: transcriptional regulator BetI [Alphaproteobacteria bacterium]|nr:MAG: transcriptional regulator BetI [Alphaproteobacteria bacterium]